MPITTELSKDQYTVSLLHFRKGVEDLYLDEVEGKVWQPVGTIWTDMSQEGIQLRYDEDNVNYKSALYCTYSQYLSLSYPIILGGQDFTIEAVVYAEKATGSVFSFYNENDDYIKKNYRAKDRDKNAMCFCICGAYSQFELFGQVFDLNDPHVVKNQDPKVQSAGGLYTKFHFAIVYHHVDQNLIGYINGYECFNYKKDEGETSNPTIVIPRTAFMHGMIGRYYNTKNVSFFNPTYGIYIDDLRIADGVAIYNKEFEFPMESEVVYDETSSIRYQIKALNHFDSSAIKNDIPSPAPLDNLIDDCRYLNFKPNPHQYLELANGLELGNKSFVVEGFAYLPSDEKPEKQATVFEFNANGCTDPDTYIKLVYTPNGEFILSQSNVIPGVKNAQAYRTIIANGQRFHWAVCYKLGDGSNDSILGLFINGRAVHTIRAGRMPRMKFDHILLGSNIKSDTYSYFYSFKGNLDEFRISDGISRFLDDDYVPPVDEVININDPIARTRRKVIKSSNLIAAVDGPLAKTKRIVTKDTDTLNNYRGLFFKTKRIVVKDLPEDGIKFKTRRRILLMDKISKVHTKRIVSKDFKEIKFDTALIHGHKKQIGFDTERIVAETEYDMIVGIRFNF